MPVYEYTCAKCRCDFERLTRSAAERDKVACPKCGSKKVERKMSTFAARGRASRSAAKRPAGGCCGRCGDPNGPCSL